MKTPAHLGIAGLLLCCLAAQAGPLLDRIRAQRAQGDDAQQTLEDSYGDGAAKVPGKTRVLQDVAYGSDARQRMDVYLPAQAAQAGGAPVIFMVHGGAWRIGDKRSGSVVDNKVARWVPKGFVFISVNNRLLPNADPLEQARDVASALAKAQQQAASWGADPRRFVLMGHSAGAHLVALLAASPTLAQEAGAAPWLGTVALDSAALDVAPIMQSRHYRLYDPAFGTDPAYWRAVSPLQLLQAGAKPMLAVCSSRRDDSCTQARGFVAKANGLGVRAQVLPQDLSHGDINKTLGLPGAYTDAVERFMASLDPALAALLGTR